MKTNDKSKFMSLINCLIIFVFSVFVNRGISLTSTSLGLDLQNLSDSLPQINGFLQPHRILLPILGRVLTTTNKSINKGITKKCYVMKLIILLSGLPRPVKPRNSYKFKLEKHKMMPNHKEITNQKEVSMFQWKLSKGEFPF